MSCGAMAPFCQPKLKDYSLCQDLVMEIVICQDRIEYRWTYSWEWQKRDGAWLQADDDYSLTDFLPRTSSLVAACGQRKRQS